MFDKIKSNSLVHSSVEIGDCVFLHDGAIISDFCIIDGFTQIWPGVKLESGVNVGSGVVFEKPKQNDKKGILVKNNSQIGAASIIRQGVVIGQGAIIKPGSLIECNVPPYAIVSGNPARITGYVESLEAQQFASTKLNNELFNSSDFFSVGVGAVTIHRLKKVCDPRGDLSVGEFLKDIPFVPRRYFIVFNVPSEKTRGEHAHYKCHQFLICVKGSCAVVVDDGKSRSEITLDCPEMGIHLPPLTWGIQYKYSSDAVLLVFTSDFYDAGDYIRDYSEFMSIVS